MDLIDSPQNQWVKLFRSLASTKGRREHGLFIIEGVRGVRELLASDFRPAIGYVCEELVKDEDLATALAGASGQFFELSRRAFEALSDTVSPQGIAAAVAIPNRSLADLPRHGAGVVLAVHDLRDPGNMGAMIRNADAAGALGVVAAGSCVDFYEPKVVRAAAGAVFHLPLVACGEGELLAWAQETGAAIVAADTRAEQACHEVALPERAALLIGGEAHGLPERLLTGSRLRVRIPMPGRAESLNAAVAAGILLYEFNRQRL